VGLSADPVERQQEFAARHSLGYPLLSDPDRRVAALTTGTLSRRTWSTGCAGSDATNEWPARTSAPCAVIPAANRYGSVAHGP
jgi:hypothetical protein